jgi:hypothetical protein
VVGPVVITLAGGVSINVQLGAANHPVWLVLNVATSMVSDVGTAPPDHNGTKNGRD